MDLKTIFLICIVVLFVSLPIVNSFIKSSKKTENASNGCSSPIISLLLFVVLFGVGIWYLTRSDNEDDEQISTELLVSPVMTAYESEQEIIEDPVINGKGFTLTVPKGWHSNETYGESDYDLSYSVSSWSSNLSSHNSNSLVNISISSIDMGEYDESDSYFYYCLAAEEMIGAIQELIDEEETFSLSKICTDEECKFGAYPAYSIKFSCPNDIDTVDLTMAKYETDENGITTIVNYDSLPTITQYDVPCWVTFYYLYSENWFISVEVIVPKETEEDMMPIAEDLFSMFKLNE